MTYRATAPILALAALFVACAAEVEADIASGWTDYTLGPPLEITPQSVISKRSGQTTQNDYVLNNVIATPGGLWTFVSVSHGIAHWHDGAWRRVFAPGLPPDDFTVQYSDRGPDGSACFVWRSVEGDGTSFAMFRAGKVKVTTASSFTAKNEFPKRLLADRLGTVWCDERDILANPDWKDVGVVTNKSKLYTGLRTWGFHPGYLPREESLQTDELGRVWCAGVRFGDGSLYPPVVVIDPAFSESRRPVAQDNEWACSFAVVNTMGEWLTPEYAVEPPKPDRVQSRVVRGTDNFFRVVVRGRDVWKVNPVTMEGTLLWHGDAESSPWIYNVVETADGWYAVAGGELFRIESHNLMPVFPCPGAQDWGVHAITAEGAWIAGGSSRLRFLPADGSPCRVVDNQTAKGLNDIYSVALLPGGDAVGYNNSGLVVPLPSAAGISPKPPLLPVPAEGSMGQIPPDPKKGCPGLAWTELYPPAVRSADGRLYGFPNVPVRDRIARWDGVCWRYLGVPKWFTKEVQFNCQNDVLGNLWIFGKIGPDGRQTCAKFLPDEERWQEHDDVERLIPTLGENEMLFPDIGGMRIRPVRNARGETMRITSRELSLFADGKWRRWSADDLLKEMTRADSMADPLSPVIPVETIRRLLPSNLDAFYDGAVITRIKGGGFGLQFPSGTNIELKDGAWTPTLRAGNQYCMDYAGMSESYSADNNNSPGTRWLSQLECSYELKEGCLYRVFRDEMKPVFSEMPASPLPVTDTSFAATAGPGGWPLFSLPTGMLFVLFDPILARPQATVEIVNGNYLRIDAKGLPEGGRAFWRENWPDDKSPSTRSEGRTFTFHDKPEKWKSVADGGTVIGPFEDGDRIIEVVGADAQAHASETMRAVVRIDAHADVIGQWARALVDAWPQHASEAEASLREKGSAALDGLRQALKTVPPEKAPALRRMIQIVDADQYVEAPQPPVRLPESPTNTSPTVEQVSYGRSQDLDGWVWRVGNIENARYSVSVWTGQRWFSRPANWGTGLWPLLAVDSAHRLWLTGHNAESPIRIFSPLGEDMLGEGTWKKYDNLRDALDACWEPSLRFSEGRIASASPLCSLVGAPNGDLAFAAPDALHARISGRWRRWGPAERPGMFAPAVRDWHLWYDGGNRLTVVRREDVLRLAPSGEWSVKSRFGRPFAGASGAPSRNSVWERLPDGLHCTSFGVSALVVPNAELPSACTPQVGSVLIDPAGTMFIESAPDGNDCLRIHCSSIPPKTNAAVAIREDGVRVIRVERPDASLRHAWHLDGGPWHDAVADSEIVLPPLPAGWHNVEVCAVNAAALPDPRPLRLGFEAAPGEIKPPEPAVIDALLQKLANGPISDKEQAARDLVKLGVTILPKARALLKETKDESVIWWTEVVIQHIEKEAKPADDDSAEPDTPNLEPKALIEVPII